MRSFFRFFAEHNLLATIIVIMVILLGVNRLTTIKRESYPKVDFGIVFITTRYPGASPEDVELNVTNKIEDELKNVTGIDQITSVSVENVSVITVRIDPDEPGEDEIKSEIREAVSRVTNLPPEVTESPLVVELNTNLFPVIEVGLSGDLTYRELRKYASQFEKKLKEVPGVSKVEKFGYRTREIRIEVSAKAVKDYQIPLREIIAAVQGRNIRATAGSFESYTSEKNLVTLAQFKDPMEVRDVIVRSTFEGPRIRIKDLAVVKDDFEEERLIARMNGEPAIAFLVYKDENADVIRTVGAVKKLVEKERRNLPDEVKILSTTDFSKYVGNRLTVVLRNGIIGLAFVLVLLTICLNIRTAFWVAMGIPFALLGTIFLMPLFGVYLDSLSLASMILVLGIIVDDAIIISENIFRHRELGEPPLKAAVEGVREVFFPVLATVLTTFLAFAPMLFMKGIFGKFIFVIPAVISLALFISLAEATLILPAHLMPGLRRQQAGKPLRNWCTIFRNKYRRIVKQILRFRYILVLVFIALFAISMRYAFNNLKFILFTSNMADRFDVIIELPIGSSLQATSDKIREIENLVSKLPMDELSSFDTRVGNNPSLNAESENYAYISVNLTPFAQRKRTAEQIIEALRQNTDTLQGYEKITYSIESGGPPVGKPIEMRIVGSNDTMRTRLADSVQAFLQTIDGVKDIERDDKLGKEQVEIKLRYDRLSSFGLAVADIAQNVRLAYDGQIITSVCYGDENVNFRVLIEEEARKKLEYLNELLIPNRQGRLIALKQVAILSKGPGTADYRHYNGERAITIEADLATSAMSPTEATNLVSNHFDLDKDWPGMRFVVGGEVRETQKAVFELLRALLIAAVGIYFLLVLLFNSVTQPLIVMMAIPFGFMGVILTFGIHNEPLSFIAMLGMIGLAGVVVNDSLVLVSRINELRRKRPKESVLNIVAEGTADRLRAVILTTITTVAALLPLAYGIGGTDPFMAPSALALGYGLVFATPLTLVFVPCLYMVRNDIERGIKHIGRFMKRKGKR